MQLKLPFKSIVTAVIVATCTSVSHPVLAEESNNCHPKLDSTQSQYIIGYGSLMEKASRSRTTPNAGEAYPILVKGYQRGWFAQTPAFIPLGMTALGIIPDQKSSFNAVVYQLPDVKEVLATDEREMFYCRRSVSNAEFELLKPNLPFPKGQVWIYAFSGDPKSLKPPTQNLPIVQSYVDIFISGCLEQAQRYDLKDFADRCIQTTTMWSGNWVNDRIYPRRPFVYQPKSFQIDQLLKKQLPQFFRQIRIE